MTPLSQKPQETPQKSQGFFNILLNSLSKPNLKAMGDNLSAAGGNLKTAFNQWQDKPANTFFRDPKQGIKNIRDSAGNLLGGNQAELGKIASQSVANPVVKNVVGGFNRVPGGFVDMASMGGVQPLKNKPATTPGETVADVAGGMAGLVTPGGVTSTATRAIKSTGAFKPFQQVMGHMAGQQIAKGGVVGW